MKRLPSVRLVALFALVALIATFAPVTAQDAPPTQNLTDACVENFDPDTDYFPDKIEIVNATGFEVEYFNHYKVVTVTRPWPGADEDAAVTYVLVQCGTPAPDDIEADAVINVPVNTFVSMSTTYLPYMDLFGVLDGLVGVDMASLASNEAVLDKAAAGELVDIAPNFNVDIETAIDLDPELIFTYGFGFETDSYLQLTSAGLPVALNGEFAEITPLARAEWGKYLSLFFNAEAIAEADYSAILDEYAELSEMAAQVEDSPTVFLNSPFDGVWYMPGGVSYMATFLQDANVDYLWSDDDSTGVLFLDFEAVFDIAADADFWINANQFWTTVDDALAEDSRYGEFEALQTGDVWINNLTTNELGANDFFESGAAYPNLILADLVAIFHPELLPDHEFVYYQQLAE